MAPRSLRRRLTVTVISIFLTSWVISAVFTTFTANVVLRGEVDKMLNALLDVSTKVGESLIEGELEALQSRFSERMVVMDAQRRFGDGTTDNPLPVRFDENFDLGSFGSPAMNIWVGGIQLVVGDRTPLFAHPESGNSSRGQTEQQIDDQVWQVQYRHDPELNVWYAAGVARSSVPFDAGSLLLRMLQPLALIIPLTVVALYLGIHNNLRPLKALSRLIESRRLNNSLEPIAITPGAQDSVPQELAPVVDSLNHLLERLADTLENEKRFTANAAHELQTPLAAIMTEVQLCQRRLTDPGSQDMMNRIIARVERASYSVKQLLILARLDPQSAPGDETVVLSDVLETAVLELGHLVEERNLQLRFDVDSAARVQGNREALLILFRNLIGNAFRYTPAGGEVAIRASAASVCIENTSAELDQTDRLIDRFFRGPNTHSGALGSGLGLSIADRICVLYGAKLTINCRNKVFAVQVQFPS